MSEVVEAIRRPEIVRTVPAVIWNTPRFLAKEYQSALLLSFANGEDRLLIESLLRRRGEWQPRGVIESQMARLLADIGMLTYSMGPRGLAEREVALPWFKNTEFDDRVDSQEDLHGTAAT